MMEDQKQGAWGWLKDNAPPVMVLVTIITSLGSIVLSSYIYINPPTISNVTVGPEQFVKVLMEYKKEITKQLETVHEAERQVLIKEKNDIDAAYQLCSVGYNHCKRASGFGTE